MECEGFWTLRGLRPMRKRHWSCLKGKGYDHLVKRTRNDRKDREIGVPGKMQEHRGGRGAVGPLYDFYKVVVAPFPKYRLLGEGARLETCIEPDDRGVVGWRRGRGQITKFYPARRRISAGRQRVRRVNGAVIKGIYTVDDWFRLAPPARGERHWRNERGSAKELAKAWCGRESRLGVPIELQELLKTHPDTDGAAIFEAIPEQKVRFR